MSAATVKEPLLCVERLGLVYQSQSGALPILNDVSFTLGRGEILGIIGESGAGKSTVGNAILGLLAPEFLQTSGTISLDGKRIDLDPTRAGIRGHKVSAIFQDHTASLDPLMCVGDQIIETIRALDPPLSRSQARDRALDLMVRVGILDASARYHRYPHQFSGGQRQRLVIAIALAGSPDLIIADEPTSALDATVQKQILQLLRSLVDDTGVSLILVTHDMGVIAELTDRVLVMRRGDLVEQGITMEVLGDPRHDYTRHLLAAVPRLQTRRPDRIGGDGGSRSSGPLDTSSEHEGPLSTRTDVALQARAVTKSFAQTGGLTMGRLLKRSSGRRESHSHYALQDVDITLERGKITAIVGESGSGKTTIGRILAGLETAQFGHVTLDGDAYDVKKTGRRTGLLGRVQMIFQDPAVSLNPRMTVGDTLRESVRYGSVTDSDKDPIDLVTMVDRLGLARALLGRHPHQLSGGQKQRVCIARALLAKPRIVIADEPTSALDVSVQADIVSLLKETISERQMTMAFISHDLALVQGLCDRIYVLRAGRIEDEGSSEFIFAHSNHPYTRQLIEARSRWFTC
jgi:peptide/nickel transport system ATP-binding protein